MKHAIVALCSVALLMQSPIRSWRVQHEVEMLDEFAQLLRQPMCPEIIADMQANATLLEEHLRLRGINLQRPGAPCAAPAVFGESKVPGATKERHGEVAILCLAYGSQIAAPNRVTPVTAKHKEEPK